MGRSCELSAFALKQSAVQQFGVGPFEKCEPTQRLRRPALLTALLEPARSGLYR